jgi:hypothetical protein
MKKEEGRRRHVTSISNMVDGCLAARNDGALGDDGEEEKGGGDTVGVQGRDE